jgi:hypothetical protein
VSVTTRERNRSPMTTVAAALSGFPDKRLSRASGNHPKVCARWRRDEAVPSGDAVLRMMREDAEICAALLEAANRADDAARIRAAAALRVALKEFEAC